MTDEQVLEYLRDNGYPEHVIRGGKHGLIQRWNRFVDEVARGYKAGIEDYRNDLDIRGIIEMAGIGREVADADARLKPLLTATDTRIWESGVPDAFWDFGYPRNAAGELLDDLRDEGLAD